MTASSSLPLLPLPNGRVRMDGERLLLPRVLRVSRDASRSDFDHLLLEYLAVFAQRSGIEISDEGAGLLRFYRNTAFPEEGYRLRVTKERGIQIEAATERGVCWALATLCALIENQAIACCDIMDAPACRRRGILLDSARHFFPVEVVKDFIEALSLAKINALHWHLTDDQGWRVESKLFPKLHAQCAPAYYTQDDLRDVIEFARARGVEIIPEIDLPGHVTSILAAYPELSCSGRELQVEPAWGIYATILCAGKEEVFDLLLPLLEEIAGIFPSPQFHLGGDEAPKTAWRNCPLCQKRMEEENLASEEELQGWFTARAADHLRGLGKQPICWNESLLAECLPGLAPDLTIQYWAEMHKEGPTRRFQENGGAVIFSDMMHAYLDQPHGLVPLKTVYQYAPEGPAIGMEACVWTEFIETPEQLARMAFPRAYALAEAAWTQPRRKDYNDFRCRLALWLERFPGPGYTFPAVADPALAARYKERV
ncbi:MAG: beta-N-acetylhexosaminidase, partial [Desulfovibrionaceae bacterium]|nr:beta-N-acetylhexosaminidase [Desulfovibrionaceae bacterium]